MFVYGILHSQRKKITNDSLTNDFKEMFFKVCRYLIPQTLNMLGIKNYF